jgi:hypothetical protein
VVFLGIIWAGLHYKHPNQYFYTLLTTSPLFARYFTGYHHRHYLTPQKSHSRDHHAHFPDEETVESISNRPEAS